MTPGQPPAAFGAIRYRKDGQQYVATELGSDYRGTGETPHAAIRAYLDTVEEVAEE